MPVEAYVTSELPEHVETGGVVHVMPAHGSGLHAPDAQPYAHVVSVGAYVQLPDEHVPALAYVRSELDVVHCGGGGVVQLTPEQGSGWHAPALQPKLHAVVVDT